MTTNSSRPELRFNRYDAIVAVIVALLAVFAALWFYLPKTGGGGDLTVVISVAGQETEREKLSGFAGTVVSHEGYTLTVSADGESVWVSDSDCPTQDCVHTGHIRRSGQSIVCLPAQVVIHLEGAASADAPDVIVG